MQKERERGRLPVRRLTLYKHGVGFFERGGTFEGERLRWTFRRDELNDVLKSFTVVDQSGGRVLGVDYATPQSRESRLSGCAVRPTADSALQALLVDLRGQRVRLLLDQGETLTGKVVGLDVASEQEPLSTTLVSVLSDEAPEVHVVPLGRVQGVVLLTDEGREDLRFFLETLADNEEIQTITVRLTPGAHDLSIGYLAPAPTWRVSYRLLAELDEDGQGEALLQGWGIFDNQLEEDLEEVAVTLVAGMPLSFVYDLATPFTPERPVVKEEARVTPQPVSVAAKLSAAPAPEPTRGMEAMQEDPTFLHRRTAAETMVAQARGETLGHLFAYVVETPVSVGRGQTAMAPILSHTLRCEKVWVYNAEQLTRHPVAVLRFTNAGGFTLERGPVTVLEAGTYVGEAVLPFTPVGGEVTVPYAVELGVSVREKSGKHRTMHGLQIKDGYLLFEEWDVRWRTYQVSNHTEERLRLLIEHPRSERYALFDVPEIEERTETHVRFAVEVEGGGETSLRLKERRLVHRREEIRGQSYQKLQGYVQGGLIDRATLDRLAKLLMLWDTLADYEGRLEEMAAEREKQYRAQEQIRANLETLSQTGKEGALRARYVQRLEQSEETLQDLTSREAHLKQEIERVKVDIAQRLEALEEA
ncbi:MAG: hypothetical protein ACP5HM_09470 [Anaerolineae bacterium]